MLLNVINYYYKFINNRLGTYTCLYFWFTKQYINIVLLIPAISDSTIFFILHYTILKSEEDTIDSTSIIIQQYKYNTFVM